jgi:hypothetical protein
MTDPVKEELRGTLIAAASALRDGAKLLDHASQIKGEPAYFRIKSDLVYLEAMATIIDRTLART